jgi:hypothetical protein
MFMAMFIPPDRAGYGPQVGHSPEGFPVYLYTDPHTHTLHFVVVLPDGRAFFSDYQGRIGSAPPPPESNTGVALALIGGIAGFLLGAGGGAIIGAIAGGVLGSGLSKRRPTQ